MSNAYGATVQPKKKQKFVDDVISLRVNFVHNVKHPTLYDSSSVVRTDKTDSIV